MDIDGRPIAQIAIKTDRVCAQSQGRSVTVEVMAGEPIALDAVRRVKAQIRRWIGAAFERNCPGYLKRWVAAIGRDSNDHRKIKTLWTSERKCLLSGLQ